MVRFHALHDSPSVIVTLSDIMSAVYHLKLLGRSLRKTHREWHSVVAVS